MLRRFTSSAALFSLALLVSVSALHAQLSTRATITGTVTDSTGAVVSGATVTITDEATKVAIKTQTNSDGVYVAPGLTVDSYTVIFAKAGFKTYSVTGIELHPTETVAVNGVLAVGAATQTVTVRATSTEVETSTAEVSADIDSDEVSTLPMNGRNYQGVAVMMPGVTNGSQGNALGTGGRSTSSVLSINGLDVSRSFYVLDGVWNENTGNMTANAVVPNPDSLEEVRVLQNNFSAQYSLLGSSVIIAQTKSGSANWHGTAWEFWRNNDLNSKNYFSTTIPAYKQNIFGYNASGPVYIPHHYNSDKKKTFFFWDEQWVILHVPSQNLSTVPTAQQEAGCFISPIKDPGTAGTPLFPKSTGAGSCPAGYYQIPSARINASSAAYLATLYPVPNYVLANNTTNYINNQAQITDQRDDEIKIDHNFNPKYHAMGEYLDEYQSYAQNTVSTGSTPINSETDFTHNKLAQASLTQTLSSSMINTTSVAMNIYLLNLTLVGIDYINQLPGFTESLYYPNGLYANRVPVVSFTGGMNGQGITGSRPIPHASDLDNTVTDNWSWLKGKHYLTAGITFVWNTKRQVSGQQTNGSFAFSGVNSAATAAQKTATGGCSGTLPSGVSASGQCSQDDSLADMLLGYINTFSQASDAPHGDIHAFSWTPYVEDQFKFNKNLSLTLGVRLYHLPLPYGVPNSETNWDAGITPGNIYNNPAYVAANAPTVNEFSGATNLKYPATYSNGMLYNSGTSLGLPVNFSNAHTWYVGPDAGFAWDVFGNGKTSLRGGYGISYTRIFTNQDCSFNCIANPPVFSNQNLSNLTLPSTAGWDVRDAGGSANTESVISVTGGDYQIGASPAASYSLGLQHEFPMNIIASVAGAGSRLQHLEATWNWNQAPYYVNPTTGVAYDYNPLIASNAANSNKGDSAAYWAPYQGYNSITVYSTRLWQEWNGLEAQIKHPMTKSLYLAAAYTWSHDTSNSVVDPYNLNRFHGNNGLNYPQTMNITVLYELPFFQHSGNVLEKEILGGWRINDISTFRSGGSITPGITLTNAGLTSRPFVVPGVSTNGPKTWKTGSTQQWFNEAAFVDPTAHIGGVATNPLNATLYYGYYGNAQNGTIRGPGQEIYNLSLFKEFRFRETNVVEFRAEAFNLLNHTNPQNPNASVANANEDKITAAYDPRIMELALRYKF